jgi:hypothetical protein
MHAVFVHFFDIEMRNALTNATAPSAVHFIRRFIHTPSILLVQNDAFFTLPASHVNVIFTRILKQVLKKLKLLTPSQLGFPIETESAVLQFFKIDYFIGQFY